MPRTLIKSPEVTITLDNVCIVKPGLSQINTNVLNILTSHVVIASPEGVAISFFMGLLRRLTPRNDNYLLCLY